MISPITKSVHIRNRFSGASVRIAALLALLGATAAVHATLISTNRATIPNSVPSLAVAAASDLGPVSSDATLKLAFALPWKDQGGLDDLLTRLYDPADPLYGHYLSAQDFANRFGPDPADVQVVSDYAVSQGLTIDSIPSNRLLIDASGPASAFESALGVSIHQYQAQNGDLFVAPTSDPQAPLAVASRVSGILGFGDHVMHPLSQPLASSGNGTGPDGTLSPADIRKAYQFAQVSETGSGQTLAAVELSGYLSTDIASFVKYFNIAAVPLENVLIDGFSGTVTRRDTQGASEAALDIEMMNVLAPGASKILVYEIANGGNVVDLFNRIATDNKAGSISISWGQAESQVANSDLQAENTVFEELAAQGQSIFAASGDNGAYDDGSSISVDDPSTQPYVCGVGGTTLTLNSDGSYASETTWNVTPTLRGSAYVDGAGGGGISSVWKIPTWQKDAIASGMKGSTVMRNSPDVSLNAGFPIAVVAMGGVQYVGGTSADAPLWTAFAALVNQRRSAGNLSKIGFLNPSIYPIGLSSKRSTDFHDIADGSNNGYYPATTGYDDATGWGSFNGSALLADLSGSSSTATLSGDINGDGKVNVTDAMIALEIAVGLVTPTQSQISAGDVLKIGKIDVSTATRILQIAVGLVSSSAS